MTAPSIFTSRNPDWIQLGRIQVLGLKGKKNPWDQNSSDVHGTLFATAVPLKAFSAVCLPVHARIPPFSYGMLLIQLDSTFHAHTKKMANPSASWSSACLALEGFCFPTRFQRGQLSAPQLEPAVVRLELTAGVVFWENSKSQAGHSRLWVNVRIFSPTICRPLHKVPLCSWTTRHEMLDTA